VPDFLAAIHGLTVRGLCFVATGLTCCVLAVTIGEKDLFRIGVLLLALPVCAAAFICKTRYRLACNRRLTPARVAVGDAVSVTVRIDNMSGRLSSVLLVDDEVPDSLGPRARFVLNRVEAGGVRSFTYTLRPQVRGRYLIGPMAIRITDPFGLCELTRAFRSRDELIVTPPVEILPLTRPEHRPTIGAHHRQRTSAAAGTDDFATRPYQAGDDLRRVHWRTSARTGGLMVRQEENVHPNTATLLLDIRSAAWSGAGPGSPFEWAVGAAASVAVHLTRMGRTVQLVCAGTATTLPTAARRSRNPAVLLDTLAIVNTTDAPSIRGVSSRLRTADSAMVVAILGHTDPARSRVLALARPRATSAIVILIDVATWNGDHAPGRDATLQACRSIFQLHGWIVITAGYGDRLAALWPGPARRRPGADGRTGTAGGWPVPVADVIHDGPHRPDPASGGPAVDGSASAARTRNPMERSSVLAGKAAAGRNPASDRNRPSGLASAPLPVRLTGRQSGTEQ
jgi:uncharacterized protein (DUF58 family)